jgi:hypothetical protein
LANEVVRSLSAPRGLPDNPSSGNGAGDHTILPVFSLKGFAMFRLFSLGIATALLLASAPLGIAAEGASDTHEGRVVTVGDHDISILDKQENTLRFMVAADAKITLDGKKAKLAEVDIGGRAIITTSIVGGKTVAVKIMARSRE